MISRPIRIQPAATAQRAVCGWHIAGGDTGRWLAEIGGWQVDESLLRLYLLPEDRDNLEPSGVLVVGAGLADLAIKPAAMAYGLMGQNIYLPVEAVLMPALSEDELKIAGHYDLILFHPVLGPVGFDRESALRVSDLLISAPRRADGWSRMIAGTQASRHIHSVSFRFPPLVEDLFGEAGKEIGVESPKELPGSKKQPMADMAGSMAMEAGGKLLEGFSKILGSFPHTGIQRTAFNQFEDWVNSRMKGVMENLEKRRNRELHRLLEELNKDPDKGLRHAIPLSPSALNRGIAPKSGQLGERSSDFDIRRLGGGQAADFWDIPADLQKQLRTHYIALAERERQLGRHRRSAYIYAELLGDLSTAALILKEGRFFRDAAVLYRDHLFRPLEAADCFVEARLILEAVALYEKEQAWESLAALYHRIGETEKAREAMRLRVDSLLGRGDLLQAVEILRSKLGAHEEAEKLIKGAWPHHKQAAKCAEKYFQWCAEKSDHEAARVWLQELNQSSLSPSQEIILCRIFIHLQSSYPDRELRLQAEDYGRLKIAGSLPGRDESERKERVHLLANLVPDDRLLRKDAMRYLDLFRIRSKASVPPVRSKIPAQSSVPEILHDFSFPQRDIHWSRVVSLGDRFFVLGQASDFVWGARSSFDGNYQMEQWPMRGLSLNLKLKTLLCADSSRGYDDVYLRALYRNEIAGKLMPSTDVFSKRAFVGTPGWLTDDPLAAAFDPNGGFWVWRHIGTGLQLTSYQGLGVGVVRSNLEIPFLEQEWVVPAFFGGSHVPVMAVLEQRIVMGLGRKLHVLDRAHPSQEGANSLEFEEDIVAILPGPKWTKPHLAVVLEHQVLICWLDGPEPQITHVENGLEAPVVTFTNGGTLVVITPDKGYLFNCSSQGVQSSCQFERKGEEVIAVIPGPEARSYSTVGSNGNVKTFKFNSEMLK